MIEEEARVMVLHILLITIIEAMTLALMTLIHSHTFVLMGLKVQLGCAPTTYAKVDSSVAQEP